MKETKNFLYLFGVFLVVVLFLVIVLYRYTTKELSDSYTKSAENQLIYANNNLAEKSREVELLATSVLTDDTVRFFKDKMDAGTLDDYEYVQTIKKIRERIKQVQYNSIGIEAVQLYWPSQDLVLSTKSKEQIQADPWFKDIKVKGRHWGNHGNTLYFSTSYPYVDLSDETPDFFVVIELKSSYLREIKDSSINLHDSKALIRLPDGTPLFDSNKLDGQLLNNISLTTKETELTVKGQKLKVLSRYNANNGLQVISYFDMGAYMGPVRWINGLTLFVTFLILFLGMLVMYLFYKDILSQLEILILKFRKVENGDLSTRIENKSNNEFRYVFEQFNQMVTGVDRLLLSLNSEYQRRDTAEQKQLQAQINPHFLYNSLFYIISVAENPKATRAMATHLAEYYQYRTRAKDLVLLEEEVGFARSYLSIMAMRKSIFYEIHVEEDLLDEMLLPLLIQPLLENAIHHGIEEKEGAHRVCLNIYKLDSGYEVSVEDDGKGLNDKAIIQLTKQINQAHQKNGQSIGLWNVNHRLINFYGANAHLCIEKSTQLGGLKVSFKMQGED